MYITELITTPTLQRPTPSCTLPIQFSSIARMLHSFHLTIWALLILVGHLTHLTSGIPTFGHCSWTASSTCTTPPDNLWVHASCYNDLGCFLTNKIPSGPHTCQNLAKQDPDHPFQSIVQPAENFILMDTMCGDMWPCAVLFEKPNCQYSARALVNMHHEHSTALLTSDEKTGTCVKAPDWFKSGKIGSVQFMTQKCEDLK
jgi:hypothetical protein